MDLPTKIRQENRRIAPCNTGLIKEAVQCSTESFVVNQSLDLSKKLVVIITNFLELQKEIHHPERLAAK